MKMPAAFGRINTYSKMIQDMINDTDEEILKEYWEVDQISDNRIRQWCQLVSEDVSSNVYRVLTAIFSRINLETNTP